MNRPPGELSWTMEYVIGVTGEHISTMFYSKQAAANPMSKLMGAPGPSWEFRKGKPALVAAGQRFEAVVNDDAVVKLPASAAAPQGSDAPSAGASGQPMAQKRSTGP
jgi:hypothetical protein